MTTLDNLICTQMAAIKQDEEGDWFHCQFCPMSFGMHDEYKMHTFGHFSTRTCSGCNARLVQICDEWFEVHTVANCRNNNHVHTFNTNNTNNDNNESIVVVKQEPPAEVEPIQLDELLNVKTDVDLDDFGEIFAANLNTLEMNENNSFDHNYHQNSINNTGFQTNEFNNSIPQFKYQVVNITMKDRSENERTRGFQCRFCDKILFSRFRLDTHIQSHHMTDQTSCRHCGQRFTTFERLDKHLKRCAFNNRKREYIRSHPHRPAGNFVCDICGSKLKKFRTLIDHMNEVHSSKLTFQCRICQRMYRNRYYLAKHMHRHKKAFENGQDNGALIGDLDDSLIERRKYVKVHPHRPLANFICDICGKEISRIDLLEEHMSREHAARDSFQCRLCGRYYCNRYYLQKHMVRHKKAAATGVEMTDEDLDKGLMERSKYQRLAPEHRKAMLTCNECGKEFKHHYLLMEHKSSRHTGKSVFECRKCRRKYPNRYYLTKHMKRHEEAEKSGIPLDQLPRDLDEGLMERAKYVRPDANTEGKTIFDCDECGAEFKRFCHLTEHKRAKHQIGFACRKCHRTYPNRYYLAKHMKRHDENAAQDIANSSDSGYELIDQRQDVLTHPHEPKSDFTCESCGMTYTKYKLLREHIISNHSSMNSEMCRICNKFYPNRYYLQKHMKRHQENKDPEDGEGREEEEEKEEEEVLGEEVVVGEEEVLGGGKLKEELLGGGEEEKEEEVIGEGEEKGKEDTKCEKRDAKRRKKEKKNEEGKIDLDEDLIERNEYIRAHPHRPTSNFQCDICQKVLSSIYSIREHMQSKHTNKVIVKIPCSKCNREFKSKRFLEKHTKLKHSDDPMEVPKTKTENKQMCSICGRLFPDKSKMLQHEKTHLGIMTTCHICGKKFQYKAYLKKHIKGVHSDERPWFCGIDGCEWRFRYNPCLVRHRARKHGMVKNRNPCPICGREFPDSKYHLNRHLKSHANNTAKEYFPEPKQDSSQSIK